MHSSWERAPRDAGLGSCGRGCFGATSFNSFQVSPNFPCPCVTPIYSLVYIPSQETGERQQRDRAAQFSGFERGDCHMQGLLPAQYPMGQPEPATAQL